MDFSQDIDIIFNWTELTIACFLDPVLLKSLELVHWATDPHLRSGGWDKSDSNCVSDMHRYTLRCYCLDIWVWTDLVFAVVLVFFLDIHGGLEEEVKCQSTWQPLGPDCGAAGQPVKLGLPCRMQKLQQVWWFFWGGGIFFSLFKLGLFSGLLKSLWNVLLLLWKVHYFDHVM